MQGFIYPLAFSNGGLSITNDYPTLVKGAIMSSLNTALEERVMRPDYGLPYEEFQTVSNIVDTMNNIRQAIALGLEGYAETSFEVAGRISDNGILEVMVIYTCPDGLERTIEVAL